VADPKEPPWWYDEVRTVGNCFTGLGFRVDSLEGLEAIALIEEAAVIDRILRHLGPQTETPAPRPARASPMLGAFPTRLIGTTMPRCSMHVLERGPPSVRRRCASRRDATRGTRPAHLTRRRRASQSARDGAALICAVSGDESKNRRSDNPDSPLVISYSPARPMDRELERHHCIQGHSRHHVS
jgi:hypothetical protein